MVGRHLVSRTALSQMGSSFIRTVTAKTLTVARQSIHCRSHFLVDYIDTVKTLIFQITSFLYICVVTQEASCNFCYKPTGDNFIQELTVSFAITQSRQGTRHGPMWPEYCEQVQQSINARVFQQRRRSGCCHTIYFLMRVVVTFIDYIIFM